jgi:hypothetical protein
LGKMFGRLGSPPPPETLVYFELIQTNKTFH